MEIPLEAPFSDGGQAVALDVAARHSVDEGLPRTYLLGLAEVREEAIAPVVGVAWVAHHFEPGRQAGGVELVHRFIKACEVEADGGEVGRGAGAEAVHARGVGRGRAHHRLDLGAREQLDQIQQVVDPDVPARNHGRR